MKKGDKARFIGKDGQYHDPVEYTIIEVYSIGCECGKELLDINWPGRSEESLSPIPNEDLERRTRKYKCNTCNKEKNFASYYYLSNSKEFVYYSLEID